METAAFISGRSAPFREKLVAVEGKDPDRRVEHGLSSRWLTPASSPVRKAQGNRRFPRLWLTQ